MGSVGNNNPFYKQANSLYQTTHDKPLTLERALAEYSNYEYWYNDYISEEIERRGGTPTDDLYRGLNFYNDPTSYTYDFQQQLVNAKVGDVIQSNQLSSFDKDEKMAERFANSGGNIKVMLHLVDNTKALDIQKMSTSWLEREFLAPKNVKYRVTKKYKKGDIIYLDIKEV